MPFTPELPDTARKVRAFEILHQFDSKQSGGAQGDVGIAGEVTVNLYGKEKGCQTQGKTLEKGDIIVNFIGIRSKSIRNDKFFEKAPCHKL